VFKIAEYGKVKNGSMTRPATAIMSMVLFKELLAQEKRWKLCLAPPATMLRAQHQEQVPDDAP